MTKAFVFLNGMLEDGNNQCDFMLCFFFSTDKLLEHEC